ncbi:ribosome biogenesis GTPase YlqF [Siminovitchia sp. FSL H7-0308]|uniref:Ribosome biogenesis GTPase A n=1 Tax=Siminovitchia thermophila TaxID=1245522 RepID=A0ABS2R9W5_9BACI|nr:ribosome biogenesis GTPase YlqF [Siminovitchia thermophila]MBM7715648.1 ribosome biogenesis GTPase A [Siminovitchia thermophila]ONK23256.1 ribosome biogenesis GTPase YlqF [Bacillus sp. VT-16-64]
MAIQWFPGHMAKARREVTEKLKVVDIVFELVDARIPISSANPMLDEIILQKKRLILLNKADMADPDYTKEWIRYYSEKGHKALAINSQEGKGLKEIIAASKELLKEQIERRAKKGLKPRALRAMIIGIPNVGKSTLINRLAKRNIAKTANTPGVTRGQAWIKVGKELELLDTPGILWPKFEDKEIGYKLALTGAIKDSLLNMQDIAVYALDFLKSHYPQRLMERYQMADIATEMADLFDHIGKLRGCLMSGGEVDYDKTADIIVMDVRTQKLGRLTFDFPKEQSD